MFPKAPRPSTGPHKLRECIPLVVFLRNRLKYALTADEVKKIVKQRLIKVDGKVRTNPTYPAGYMGESAHKSPRFLYKCIASVAVMGCLHREERFSAVLFFSSTEELTIVSYWYTARDTSSLPPPPPPFSLYLSRCGDH